MKSLIYSSYSFLLSFYALNVKIFVIASFVHIINFVTLFSVANIKQIRKISHFIITTDSKSVTSKYKKNEIFCYTTFCFYILNVLRWFSSDFNIATDYFFCDTDNRKIDENNLMKEENVADNS